MCITVAAEQLQSLMNMELPLLDKAVANFKSIPFAQSFEKREVRYLKLWSVPLSW